MAGRKQKYTIEDFAKAIPGSGGLITRIAASVGCDWHTAKTRIARSKTLSTMLEAERESAADMAEAVIHLAMGKANSDLKTAVETAKWYLARIRPERFADQTRVSGPDGGDIVIRVVDDTGKR